MATSTSSIRRQEIKDHAVRLRDQLVRTRRDIYMHPELSHKETRTASVVAARLQSLGYEVRAGVGGNGVIGVLKGGRAGKAVAYRADMDALPIPDPIDTPYRSTVPGVKHACGHDAHTTIALGIAEILAARRERLPGTVKFLFQPAEETLGGAKPMVRDGALKDPRPDAVLALHVAPAPVGTLLCPRRVALAGTDSIQVTFRPFSGEPEPLDAAVERCRGELDALTAHFPPPPTSAAELGALFARLLANDPETCEFTQVRCAAATPADDSAGLCFSATVRATPRLRRDKAIERLAQIVAREAVRANADFAVQRKCASPDTANDLGLLQGSLPEFESVVGPGHAIPYDGTWPFNSEDAGFFTEHIPGLYTFLGTANPARGLASVMHTPDFDIDEEALVIGVAAMANAMVGFLEREAPQSAA